MWEIHPIKTRFDQLGGGYSYIELAVISSSPGSNDQIKATIGNTRHPNKVTAFDLSRREAYQLADTLRAMAVSTDYRLG